MLKAFYITIYIHKRIFTAFEFGKFPKLNYFSISLNLRAAAQRFNTRRTYFLNFFRLLKHDRKYFLMNSKKALKCSWFMTIHFKMGKMQLFNRFRCEIRKKIKKKRLVEPHEQLTL